MLALTPLRQGLLLAQPMKALRATLSKYSLAELLSAGRLLLADSVHQGVLTTLRCSLVVQDDLLINTQNGESRQITIEAGQSRAVAIAQAARQLVGSRAELHGILLLLPPSEFISSRFQLSLKGESMVRSAIALQAHTLIPAYDDELLLGINAQSSEGVALWYPARTAESLFVAFQAEQLFLAAIMPRTLALPNADQLDQDLILQDEDASHLAQLELRKGVVRSLLVITQHDLEQPQFSEQWQNETAKAAPAQRIRCNSREFWDSKRCCIAAQESYCFFPKGAEQYGKQQLLLKQKRFATIAAGVLAVALCLPFVGNWAQSAWLGSQVNKLRDASVEARKSQSAVYQMEDEWGAIANYPHQNVSQVLLTLNQSINSSLSTFSLNKGVVDLSGVAQDPALLIEQLAEREEFHDVGQSRSSSGADGGARGARFGIRLNLSGVDFKGYETRYPAVKQ